MHNLTLRKEIETKRLQGISAEDLAQMYSIPRGTVYQWVRNITLSHDAKNRLENNSVLGRKKGRETSLNNKRVQELKIRESIATELATIQLPLPIGKLLCAFLYWAEGAKDRENINFVNSDPKMIQTFLFLLRNFFVLDETKFRVIVHLHSYHNPTEVLAFWSKITKIPFSQFNKPYLKKNLESIKRRDIWGVLACDIMMQKLPKRYSGYILLSRAI